MKVIIAEVSFTTIVAIPDDADIQTATQTAIDSNLDDIMLEVYQTRSPSARPYRINVLKQAQDATEVLAAYGLSRNDDPFLFTVPGIDEPALSEIFPDES